jgi:hypothetical protein
MIDLITQNPPFLQVIPLLQTICHELDCEMEELVLQKDKNNPLRMNQWKELVSLYHERNVKYEFLSPSHFDDLFSTFAFDDMSTVSASSSSSVTTRLSSSSSSPSSPSTVCPFLSIDSINTDDHNITRLYFSRYYYSIQKPVLITGQLARGQGIWAYLQPSTTSSSSSALSPSIIDFLDRYGNLRIIVNEHIYFPYFYHLYCYPPYLGSKYTDSEKDNDYLNVCFDKEWKNQDKRSNLTITDFFLQAGTTVSTISSTSSTVTSSSSSSSLMMIAQTHFPYLQHKHLWFTDFQRPSIFNLCDKEKDHEDFKLTLSVSGAISPFHFHNSSYSLLLSGQKKWFLFPPSLLNNQSFFDELTSYTSLTKTHLLSSSLSTQQLKAFLLFANKYHLISEVLQSPEEVLFLPASWGHLVVSIKDSISISQEFCTFMNTNLRVQPLGYILYGNKDSYRGYGSFKFHQQKGWKD